MSNHELFTQLEAMGEKAVREQFESRPPSNNQSHDAAVRSWLNSNDRERSDASASKRDAREEETLSIAKAANEIARSASFAASAAAASASEANTISRSTARRTWRAEIIAAIAAIAAIIAAIASVIGGK